MAEIKNKIKGLGNHDTENMNIVPFDNVEEAWFWFIDAQGARNDGARFVAGMGTAIRPCEPVDILKVLDRLYRQRMLVRDHFLVMHHYGRRMIPPDPRRVKEQRAYKIWQESMDRMQPVLERKGIVRAQNWAARCYPQYATYDREGVAAQ